MPNSCCTHSRSTLLKLRKSRPPVRLDVSFLDLEPNTLRVPVALEPVRDGDDEAL